jgi:hypothetical protein
MARSDGELMRPITPRPDEADQPKEEEAGRADEDAGEAERRQSDEEPLARQRQEELKRRQLEQERLAPFAPKLLYSDSFYADREKQKEDSLEEVSCVSCRVVSCGGVCRAVVCVVRRACAVVCAVCADIFFCDFFLAPSVA